MTKFNFCITLCPRHFFVGIGHSGLHIKYDVVCAGGTIDSGYVGSIKVKLYNMGCREYMVRKGQKIVQMVIVPILTPELEVVTELSETERGSNGFGSTGL